MSYMVRRRKGRVLEYISYKSGEKGWSSDGKVRAFGSKAAAIRYLHLRGLDQSINSRNISNRTTIEIVETADA
jgi:hypothetical protein